MTRAWVLGAVGDVMLDRPPAFGNAAFEPLRQADIAFANLEVPLSRNGLPAEKPVVLRADPELASALPALGLDVVSLANNHAGDYGPAALLDTIVAVESAGVASVGAGIDLAAAVEPVLRNVGDVRTAWLAFSATLPSGVAAGPATPGIAPLRVRTSVIFDSAVTDEQPGSSPYVTTVVVAEDLSLACEAVRRARHIADVVIVSLHWGVPPGWMAGFQGPLADYQQPAAHALVDAGATVILGHHPHVLHGIETRGESVIFYSLGHAIFHTLAPGRTMTLARPAAPYRLDGILVPELQETAVFLLDFADAALESVRVVPCALDQAGEARLVHGERAEAIIERVRQLSAPLGTEVQHDRDGGVVAVRTGRPDLTV
jgi:poly-gamma-glutamate synthesis protein (capsule biosynthesis protein)